jgi:hypothetical protein
MNFALLAVLAVTGSGKLVTQERPVGPFHALSVSSGIRTQLHRGATTKVTLRADDNLIDNIVTEVKNGRLEVHPKDVWVLNNATMELDVTVASLDALEASGGTEVKGDGLSGPKCALNLSGGTRVDLGTMACEKLDIDASGGAQLKLAGSAKQLALDASGGVQLDTRPLDVKQAQIDASGGVNGRLAVAEALDAKLSGGVSIKVKGHPKVNRMETSGAAHASFED